MLAEVFGAGRAFAGRPALVQGAYGRRGNLELVVPDAHDGLWVYWRNSDLPGDPREESDASGVSPGRWSPGLHFAPGKRYRRALIAQSWHGTKNLELAALSASGPESWYWSATHAFRKREATLESPPAMDAALIERSDGTLELLLAFGREPTRNWRSGRDQYPELVWHETSPLSAAVTISAAEAPEPVGALWVTLSTASGDVLVLCDGRPVVLAPLPSPPQSCAVSNVGGRACWVVSCAGELWTTTFGADRWRLLEVEVEIGAQIAAAGSTRAGGTLEVAWLSDSGVHHLPIPASALFS